MAEALNVISGIGTDKVEVRKDIYEQLKQEGIPTADLYDVAQKMQEHGKKMAEAIQKMVKEYAPGIGGLSLPGGKSPDESIRLLATHYNTDVKNALREASNGASVDLEALSASLQAMIPKNAQEAANTFGQYGKGN